MDQVIDLQEALPLTENKPHEKIALHAEICQNHVSTVRKSLIKEHVKGLFSQMRSCYGDFCIKEFDDPFLKEHVTYISVADTDGRTIIDLVGDHVYLHVYQLSADGPAQEELEDEDLSAASHWVLPATEFNGLWESLVFDEEIKPTLLRYARTTLLFSDKKIDSNIIGWNRVILLHGPPGTGKTSLCKALAQKLSIHMSDHYSYGQLIEINSHSLFSKWFSESGKLVMKMFQKIQEMIDDPEALICVLIDEVESLTAARKSAMSGSEPSDAIRVVNAVLTQIDQIKKYPNVVILTTSNITGAIDLAFVDRADIKQYIGYPSAAAIYQIYSSCLHELMRCSIIAPKEQLFDLKALELMKYAENDATSYSLRLLMIAKHSCGLSGRTLRKLPFLAHALFLESAPIVLDVYLNALSNAVKAQFEEREKLSNT